jgi:hypothetical protein
MSTATAAKTPTTKTPTQATPRPGLIVFWGEGNLDNRSMGVFLRHASDGVDSKGLILFTNGAGDIGTANTNDAIFPEAGSLLDRIADDIAKLIARDPELGGLVKGVRETRKAVREPSPVAGAEEETVEPLDLRAFHLMAARLAHDVERAVAGTKEKPTIAVTLDGHRLEDMGDVKESLDALDLVRFRAEVMLGQGSTELATSEIMWP